MSTEFESIFAKLSAILRKHGGSLHVTDNTPTCYCLEGNTGPATLYAWGGKMKRPTIPVAWVQIGKAYVSYFQGTVVVVRCIGGCVMNNNALLDRFKSIGERDATVARSIAKVGIAFKAIGRTSAKYLFARKTNQ